MTSALLQSKITAVVCLISSISSVDALQLQATTTSLSNHGSLSSFTKQLNPLRVSTGATHGRCGSSLGIVISTTSNHNPNHPILRRSTTLSMHMGHSHSHHHHHDHKISSKPKPITLPPTSLRGKIIHQFSKRGKAISILFAAAATILPVLLFRKRSISRTDVALFAITSTAISLADKIRSEAGYIINKAKDIRDGLIKHSPPAMSVSKYLFQNDNAADRVTLVGVVINLFGNMLVLLIIRII